MIQKQLNSKRLLLVLFFIVLLSARLVSVFPNWTWFGGALILLGSMNWKWLDKVIVFGFSLVVTDIILGFYPGWVWVMIGHLGYLVCGRGLGKKNLDFVRLERPLIASVWFFLLSNFGVWLHTSLYPKTLEGLLLCYGAALPFFKNSLSADLVFFAIFMGVKIGWIHWSDKKKVLSTFAN